MIEQIIHFSIRNKLTVGLMVTALLIWGIWSLNRLPIDAVPDITNNQVQIISLAPSLAVQEVESFITAPVEVAVANIPDIIELRSISRLGLSVVTVVFKDGVDVYWARQQLNERLREAEEAIPPGLAKIELAPISTGLGEIYQYRLAVEKGFEKKYTPMELRTLQDWIVRREMLGTPGVADINSYGGFVKQYEIAVNPERLRGMNLTLTDIFSALERNNENTGSAYIDKKPNAYFIRGIGLVRTLEDIENIVVSRSSSGIPILVSDIATVGYGHATRYGALVVDTSEAVGGVVMMLKGDNAHKVIDDVNSRIVSIQQSLPKGITIEPYLNRSELVGRSIHTVARNLIEGALIVIFILVLLLGNLRAGLIVASVIPLSMLFAISMMNLFGVSGNLMSLGAIDFGLIVDGAVIIVESVVHRLYQSKHHHPESKKLSQEQMDENVLDSARKMMSSATFGQIIILIVYLPILALVGIEGKMFQPMAEVVVFALLGAAILSLTWVPMAASLFLRKQITIRRGFSEIIMDKLHQAFHPVIGFAIRNKLLVSATSLLLFIFSLLVFNKLGGEFIPQLEEGDLAAGVITLQGGSLTNTVETVIKANKILLENFPEIKHAVCKIGAGEIPTDPTPMETGDYIITLKDKSEWTSARTREELVAKMEEKLLVLAGVKFEFQQPIQMRFNELLSGSRQDVAIKVFGDDLNLLSEKAGEIEKVISKVTGVEDINVEKVTGLAQVQVNYNRERMAQYGLSMDEVNRVLRTAFAGSQAGIVYDEEKRFGLVVRLDQEFRQSLEDVRSLSVALPNGGQIPFENVADISIKSGPAQVSRENTKRRIVVGFNVRNRDIAGVIEEVSKQVEKDIKLPTGYYISYGGQFKNLEAASKRLAIAVPAALLLIFLLLYFTFHSLKQAFLIFTAVPLAAIGGVFALWLRSMNFSISAGVGFIALFGVAVLNGIVLIAEFNRLEKEGVSDIRERVLKGLQTRLRPVLLTAAVASLGFLPMALSTSAGAEVQKPLATVVIGGLISATLLTLVVLPVLYILFSSPITTNKRKKSAQPGITTILLLLFGFAISMPVIAQPKTRYISLNEAIRLAIDSNLSIQSGKFRVKEQQILKSTAWDLGRTEIEMQYGQFNSVENDNSFTIAQSFSYPSIYQAQKKKAISDIRISEWQLKGRQIGIATQVKRCYRQLAYLYARQKQLEYQDSLYAVLMKASELRAGNGETNKLEMITSRSHSFSIKNQLRQVDADIGIYLRNLQNLVNTGTPLRLSDSLLSRVEFKETADSIVLDSNPEIGLSRQTIEASRMESMLEKYKLLPELKMGYFNQTMIGTTQMDGIHELGPGDRLQGFQAGISVPLWIRPYTYRVKAAIVREKIAHTETQFLAASLQNEYASLLDELHKYALNLEYYEHQANPEAELIVYQAEKSFRNGALDYSDFVFNLNRVFEIRLGYIEALNNYNQTIISIDELTGKIY